jgi:transcriptional regulator with XRE-family HTH domain
MIVDAGSIGTASDNRKRLSSKKCRYLELREIGAMPDKLTTELDPADVLLIEWIRSGLRKPGKTQQGLADALGRAPQTVTNILKGTREIAASELAKIASYLEEPVPLEAIGLTESGYSAPPAGPDREILTAALESAFEAIIGDKAGAATLAAAVLEATEQPPFLSVDLNRVESARVRAEDAASRFGKPRR